MVIFLPESGGFACVLRVSRSSVVRIRPLGGCLCLSVEQQQGIHFAPRGLLLRLQMNRLVEVLVTFLDIPREEALRIFQRIDQSGEANVCLAPERENRRLS